MTDAPPPPATFPASRAIPLIAVAIVFAVAAWAWWTSHGRINGVVRPHYPVWDLVANMQRQRGVPYPPEIEHFSRNPLHTAALAITARLGYGVTAITAVQVPFLIAVILASALIAWRLSGPFAAAAAAWFAALGPMTVGLATNLDDLLALQACITVTVALWLWSWRRRLWPLGLLAAVPLAFGIRATAYFSNGAIYLVFAGFAGAGTILWAWIAWWRRRRSGEDAPRGRRKSPYPMPVAVTLAIGVSLYVALDALGPIPLDALEKSAANPKWEAFSVLNNPAVLRACVTEWYTYLAGPTLAVVCVLSIALALRRRKGIELLPLLAWLLLPFVAFTILNKRHDFYLVSAVPATYALAAIGFAAIPGSRRRAAATILAVLVVALGFRDAIRADIPAHPPHDLDDLFEGVPYPYLYSPSADMMMHDEAAGARVAGACAGRDLPINTLMRIPGTIAFIGMEIWRNAPDLPLGDMRFGPYFPGAHCLLLDVGVYDDKPDLDRYIDEYIAGSLPLVPEEEREPLVARLSEIRERRDAYRFAFGEGSWAMYFYEPGEGAGG
ncbi:hypothetical protein K8I61_02965 [bacterium]|nr:hypothetical protein [bacterium]